MRSHAKGAKARADKYFSLIVRSRGRCERCGTTDYSRLQCAHIVSRRYSATRCDETNAWCLCAGEHMELTLDPYKHVQVAIQTRGEDGYAALRQKALSGVRPDWDEVAADLAQRWKAIQNAAEFEG